MVEDSSSNSKLVTYVRYVERKIDFLTKHVAVSLLIVGVIGLFLRLYYFPYGIPLTSDALGYFLYATDISIIGHPSINYYFNNNGWPIFLSVFFKIFRLDNALDYMNLQRMITISISISTIIPIYFLCKRFFDKPYAIVGAAIFAFDPRIIQNSLLGITEPLFIILLTSAIVLFLSNNRKMIYLSFAIVAFASTVRTEGLFVFFPLFVMFCIHNRKESNRIAKCIFAAVIFVLILLPISIFRVNSIGRDGFTSVLSGGVIKVTSTAHENVLNHFIVALENFVKFSAWSLIPIFIFFVPIGLYLVLKERNQENWTIISLLISMIIPVFYAFSVAPDTRYIYPLFPLFCIISIFTIKKMSDRIKVRNILLIIIIGSVLLSSSIFLDFKKFDYDHQKEAFGIAGHIVGVANGINDYYSEDSYVKAAELPEKWPAIGSTIVFRPIIIDSSGFDNLGKYIEFAKNEGLTHLVLDGAKNRPNFFNDAYYHDEKYPYLIKVFDSLDQGYKYHLKIYKIDYNKFDKYAR